MARRVGVEIMRCVSAWLLIVALLSASGIAAERTPLQKVDPTIGTTHCRWFFFTPGARPFGMAKPGPCTDAHVGAPQGWNAVGYDSRHDSIESFVSFREFQIGGVAIMATSGELKTIPGKLDLPDEGYRSRFDKKDEIAEPGYYSVILKDYQIKAELTATPRVAFHRFSFESNTGHHLLFDVGNAQGESGAVIDAAVRQSGEREIEGFVVTLPVYVKVYQPGASIRMYFVARFDRQSNGGGTFRGTNVFAGEKAIQGPGAGLYLDFTPDTRSVVLKMGLSYTSLANARYNLDHEAATLSFDDARRLAQSDWAGMLGRILVKGGKEADQIKFYTGLYHALLGRGIASDANGAYSKNDGSIGRIPVNEDGRPAYNHYNSDSIWGTFWNLNQLWALAYPDFLNEYIRTHLDIYRDCGWLPDSIAAGKFVSGVGTDFAGVLISGAYNWGIRDYDTNLAYAAVMKNELGWQNRPVGVGKADVKAFLDRGYVPYILNVPAFSASTAEGSQFSASHTLEYSFAAAAAEQLARSFGKIDDAQVLRKHARSWENLFDRQTSFIRPKDLHGEFIPNFDPRKPWIGFQEGNAWQYTFYVPHELPQLIDLVGHDRFNGRLDAVFEHAEKTGFGGGKKLDAFSGLETTYNHGNQPSLHIAWLFNRADRPEKTQYWVRRICDEFYGTDRTHGYGYGQDEDQGQLGAWYVMAALGLFDIQGGTAAIPTMELSSPLFETAEISLHPRYYPGGKFVMNLKGKPETRAYLKTATFNGKELPRPRIGWYDVIAGGELQLEISDEPNNEWKIRTR